MRKRNIFWGITLIVLALVIVVTNMGFLDNIPVVRICATVLLAILGIRSLFKKEFIGFFLCGGVIGCIFSNELGIQSITPWILMVACLLIGIGFDLIFKKQTKYVGPSYESYSQVESGASSSSDWEDCVSIDNAFNEQTKYIKNQNLRRVDINNGFGKLSVYFQDANPDPSGAFVKLDNGLGQTVLFIPKTWHVNMKQNNGLGKITVYGECSNAPGAPVLNLDIDNGLGAVEINLV